jgi:hypothetical protein
LMTKLMNDTKKDTSRSLSLALSYVNFCLSNLPIK